MRHPEIRVGTSSVHGHGCFAREEIKANTVVKLGGQLIAVGYDALDENDKPIVPFDYNDEVDFYPSFPFNFLNHDKEANAEVLQHGHDGSMRLHFLRDVEAGHEILIDYGYDPAAAEHPEESS